MSRTKARAPAWRSGLAVLAATAALAGCGVPGPGSVRPVPAESVPYRLLATASADPAGTQTVAARARVAFLDRRGAIILRPRRAGSGAASERTVQLLAALEAGPSEIEREAGITSGLPAGLELALQSLDAGLAVVSLAAPAEAAPPAGQSERWPVAIAQLVLTLTSLPEVTRVQVLRDGTPVDVPLPDGRLVSRPVSRDDYASLLPARVSSPPAATRTASP